MHGVCVRQDVPKSRHKVPFFSLLLSVKVPQACVQPLQPPLQLNPVITLGVGAADVLNRTAYGHICRQRAMG